MTDRRLVVWEADAFSPGGGRLFALKPGQAAGVGLPAFRFGAGVPATGDVEGDAFYDEVSKTAFVWDGQKWLPIAPTAIIAYPDEAAMFADKLQPAGSYASSATTGTLYIKTATGWRASGIRAYPTQAALLADAAADGTVAVALDTGGLFSRAAGAWKSFGVMHFPTLTDLLAATPADGSHAIALDRGQAFVRVGGAWKPATTWPALEATILADTLAPDGTTATATDTGHSFVRAGGKWIGSPITHYPAEAGLLADSPPPGVLAFADDTGAVYGRTAAGWKRASGPTVTVGTVYPTTAAVADLHWDTTLKRMFVCTATNPAVWEGLTPGMIGEIKMWPSMAMPPNHLLCDGSVIDPKYTELIKWCGPKVPDMRKLFVRGASSQSDISGFPKRPFTTARPRNTAFKTNKPGNHKHIDGGPTLNGWAAYGNGLTNRTGFSGGSDGGRVLGFTSDAGDHEHTITAGGDTETAPDHVYLAFIICAA